ncbi:30 kDa heat shock protein [Penicillium hetheringtonii]|uniref:30 kDa heat shock protein n=1 Tax=Penicillium hetheringtonii TaxID=911720 RepID=A0AAD6DWB4_9EURO|nr:30 kDa heat shock protein [Penicillium hetheringtonii]
MSLLRTSSPLQAISLLFSVFSTTMTTTGATASLQFVASPPKFDIRESETAFHLDGELPGIAQENVNVEFTDPQTLVVKGRTEREHHITDPNDQKNKEQAVVTTDKASKAKSGHRYWASERSIGEFSRTFSFPDRIDQDNVKASLKNGILSIVVPKAAAPPTKKIAIE